MYSTCIGLILRGYHDYESGKLQLSENIGNYIHVPGDVPRASAPEVTPEPIVEVPQVPEAKSDAPAAPIEQPPVESKDKVRNVQVKKLFETLRGKFLEMFNDDLDDKEL
jgi:cell division protein FtsA